MKRGCTLYTLLALVATAAVVLAASSPSSEKQQRSRISPFQYSYLGAVGQKLYFVEMSYYPWDRAYTMCNASGMHLATIENKDQSKLLANSLAVGRQYWISGREEMAENPVWEWARAGDVSSRLDKSLFGTWKEPTRRCLIVSTSNPTPRDSLNADSLLCNSYASVICQLML